jgi:hypothetical protein
MVRMSDATWMAVVAAGSIALGGDVVETGAVSRAAALMQKCQLVSGQTLETYYPVIPGFVRGTPKSETDTQEMVSRTTVDFERGTSVISVELMDSCRNPDVLMMMNESLKQLPPATPGTVVRHTTINGFPGYEEWTAKPGNGELHVVVAGRFMVKVTAAMSDLATLQRATQLVPMQKLAAIK